MHHAGINRQHQPRIVDGRSHVHELPRVKCHRAGELAAKFLHDWTVLRHAVYQNELLPPDRRLCTTYRAHRSAGHMRSRPVAETFKKI